MSLSRRPQLFADAAIISSVVLISGSISASQDQQYLQIAGRACLGVAAAGRRKQPAPQRGYLQANGRIRRKFITPSLY